MFNLLFIFIFALATNNFLNSAEKPEIGRKREHIRQQAQSKDDFCITPIPPKTHSRKSVISLPYSISPVTPEDNLSTQNHALRRSAPVLVKPAEIVPSNLSKRSLSEGTPKKTNYFKRKKSNSKKPQIPALASIPENPEHGLLAATRDLNIGLIKFYLSSNSFNPNKPRDQFGNTAFHIIAVQKNKLNSSTEKGAEEKIKTAIAIIDIFLKDYRTDFSITNNAGSSPRELLSSNQDLLYRRIFFARCSLNISVNQYASKLKNAYLCGSISPEVIEGAVQQIVDKSKDIEASQQQDRILPSESRLPVNATIYFIEQMLLARLNHIAHDN